MYTLQHTLCTWCGCRVCASHSSSSQDCQGLYVCMCVCIYMYYKLLFVCNNNNSLSAGCFFCYVHWVSGRLIPVVCRCWLFRLPGLLARLLRRKRFEDGVCLLGYSGQTEFKLCLGLYHACTKKQKVLENLNCLQENIEYIPQSTFSSTEVIGEGGIGSENSLKAPQTSRKLSLNINQFGLAISEISRVRQKKPYYFTLQI